MLYEHLLRENPTYSLSTALEGAAEDYESAFKALWGLDDAAPPADLTEEQWSRLRELHRLAQKLAAGAAELVRPSRVREDQLASLAWLHEEAAERQTTMDELLKGMKDQVSGDFWWELYWALQPGLPDDPRTQRAVFDNSMELEANRLFSGSPYAMAGRMQKLLGVMIRQPGEFTRAYLKRVAECYVRGMDTELAVMARVVMDLALQEVIHDEEIPGLVGLSQGRRIDLERRIQAAALPEVGILDENSRMAADNLRRVGNAEAHGDLKALEEITFPHDADALLEYLATVLRSIEAAKQKS